MTNIFDTSCDLPDLPEPDYNFVGDRCAVPPAPDAIFACDQISLPPDPPPPPCPIITAYAAVNLSANIGEAGVDVTTTQGSENCEYSVDFNFTLPPAICPDIVVTATMDAEPGIPTVDATVTPGAASLCEFTFDFRFRLPPAICPDLTVNTTTTVNSGDPAAVVTVTPVGPPSACAFTLDFDFTIPPAICPDVGAHATMTAAPGIPAVEVAVTPGDQSTCEFTFDFNFTLPPAICPDLTATTTTTVAVGDPNAEVTVTPVGPASACAFTFDFDFMLPPAVCPRLEVNTVVTNSFGDPDANVTVTRVGEESNCDFIFDFDFTLPRAVCPDLTVSGNATAVSDFKPHADVTVTRDEEAACGFQLDFDFRIPNPFCPTITATGTVDILAASSDGDVGVDITATRVGESSRCELQLDFTFRLPPAPCANFAATATALAAPGPDIEALVTVTRVTDGSVGEELFGPDFNPVGCNFVFDFEFSIPAGTGKEMIDGCTVSTVTAATDSLGGSTVFLFRKMVSSGGGLVPGADILVGINRTSLNGDVGSYVTIEQVGDEYRLTSLNPFGCVGGPDGSEGGDSGGGGGGAGNCGCCNCFNCVDQVHAIVGGCTACPNGAPDQYTVALGVWTSRPELGGNKLLKYSLHDAGSLAEPCTWWSDAFSVSSEGAWKAGHTYTAGQTVINNGVFYECTTGGISAGSGSGPSGGGSSITDGTVVWKSVS